ncbi:MAG TPA: hypothetical protein VF193_17460 [Steroidobacter sp.]
MSIAAEGVMAATYKLVQQAMCGQWEDVPKTLTERRELLDRLSANAAPEDLAWLSALRQAMQESDRAIEQMAGAAGQTVPATQEVDTRPLACVDEVMDMIKAGR